MFAALRHLRPWIARLLLVTLAVGWVSASAQLCLMEAPVEGDGHGAGVHCEDHHPCCEQGSELGDGGPVLGCSGMEALSSPLLDIAAGALDVWDLAPGPALQALPCPLPRWGRIGASVPGFAATPGTHPALRFQNLRI